MAQIYWDSTQFLPKHLLQPKEFFLVSTRGVYMCLRLSSQFSAFSLGLRDIPLSAALSGECCPSQDSMSWTLGDVNFPRNQMTLHCLQSSLEPSLRSQQKWREHLQRGQYEYQRLLHLGAKCCDIISIFLSFLR